MGANDRQVGGSHYKKGGEEHWDRAWRLKYDPFQYIITKWVERWRDKGGIEDLRKAHHALEKYIECVSAETTHSDGSEPEPYGYVNQDKGGPEVPWTELAPRQCPLCGTKLYTPVEFCDHMIKHFS